MMMRDGIRRRLGLPDRAWLRVHARPWALAAGFVALLATGGESVADENFGRWFFTPLDRQKLDEDRQKGEEDAPPPPPSGEPQAAPVVDVISFDGKVERSDGTSTVWVNGRPVFTGNRTAEGISVKSSRGTSGETQFVLPRTTNDASSGQGPPPFTLKVGQKVAVQNGRKFDAYEARPGEDAESVLEESAPVEPGSPPSEAQTVSEERARAGVARPSKGQ